MLQAKGGSPEGLHGRLKGWLAAAALKPIVPVFGDSTDAGKYNYMQGTVLAAGTAQGLILGDDGERYTFTPLSWRACNVSPQVGMRVSFEHRGPQAVQVHPLPAAAAGQQPLHGSLPTQPPPAHPANPGASPPTQHSGDTATSDSPVSRSSGILSLPSKVVPLLSQIRFSAKPGTGMKRLHWALAAGGALVILGIAAAILLGIIPIFGPPIGKELSRLHYDGQVYVLVEYGDDLAIFKDNGSPVSDQNTAQGVMSSYAWQQELRSFDFDTLSDTARRAQAVNESLSSVRDLTNKVIDIFDTLDSLSADVPLIGRVSALDVVTESYDGLNKSEAIIRDLASELNALHDTGDALEGASERMTDIDTSQASVNEISDVFDEALRAAQDVALPAHSVEERVSEVQKVAGDLEAAFLLSSDTPLIGEALGDIAETISRLRSLLSALSSSISKLEAALASLSDQLQNSIDSAERASQDYMDSWLQEPHDSEWPPADPERRPAGITRSPAEVHKVRAPPASDQSAARVAAPHAPGKPAVCADKPFKLKWGISSTEVQTSERLTLRVRIYDIWQLGEHGGISVSFPSLSEAGDLNDKHVPSIADVQATEHTSGLSQVTFHQPGAPIHHRKNDRQFPAGYLLVESDDPSWSSEDDRTLELRDNSLESRGLSLTDSRLDLC